MKYIDMQNRVSANIDRDDALIYIPQWINEIRDRIGLVYPFTFLLVSNTIPLAGVTYAYAFDAGKAAGVDRYSGQFEAVLFDNGTTKLKLPFVRTKQFDRLYPTPSAGDPTCYTVRGNMINLDRVPTVVTSKNLIARYTALPNNLAASTDEGYVDSKYYGAVIAGTTARAAKFYMNEALTAAWQPEFENEIKIMIAQDSGGNGADVTLTGASTANKDALK